MPRDISSWNTPQLSNNVAFISFNSDAKGGQNMNITNASEVNTLYVYPMRDEREFNPISLKTEIEVPPSSSVFEKVGVGKGSRRLFLSCKWGGNSNSALPAKVYDHVLEKPAFNANSKRLSDSIILIMNRLAERLQSKYDASSSLVKKTLTYCLDMIAHTIGYLKTRGFPTNYLTSTKCLTHLLEIMEHYDFNTYMHLRRSGFAGKERLAEDSSETTSPPSSPSFMVDENITKAFNEDVRLLKQLKSDGDFRLFDVAISCGLYYYAPTINL